MIKTSAKNTFAVALDFVSDGRVPVHVIILVFLPLMALLGMAQVAASQKGKAGFWPSFIFSRLPSVNFIFATAVGALSLKFRTE